MVSRRSRCSDVRPSMFSLLMISMLPRIELSGLRSSWDMAAINISFDLSDAMVYSRR